ncbi:MAG: DNA polymerase III subunit beta [Bacilli bacterium]
MNLLIEKEIILKELTNVSRALSSKNIIPVLNGIKFEVNSNGLYLTATDNDITIKTFIDKKEIKEIKEEGSIIINGKYLLEIIRKIPEKLIEIKETDGFKAVISTTNSKYDLNCFSLNDFPTIDLTEKDNFISLQTDILKQVINETSFATSTQESRPLLTGINIKIIDDNFECIATDSYRLAKKILKLDKPCEEPVNIVIPSRNINELIKIFDDEISTVELHLFKNKVLFKYKNVLFQSSLLNGSYPNTDTFIPTEFNIQLEVDLDTLYNVIDRASLLSQSKDKNIVVFEKTDNQIIITSSSIEIGKVEEKMSVNTIKGDNLKISFSARFMMEALKSFNSDKVVLLLNGEIKPIVIKETTDGTLTQLILPIKTY